MHKTSFVFENKRAKNNPRFPFLGHKTLKRDNIGRDRFNSILNNSDFCCSSARKYDLSGFTLIELLMVISIIGVLSTIAMTTLSGVRAKARDTVRLSNTEQIKNALRLYYADRGTYPEESSSNGDVEWSYEDGGDFLSTLTTYGYLPEGVPLDPINNTTYNYGYYKYTNDTYCGSMIVLVASNLESNAYYSRTPNCSCRSWINNRDWAWCESY